MGLIKKKSKDLSSLEALISDFASKPIRIITILFTIFMVLFPLYWLI